MKIDSIVVNLPKSDERAYESRKDEQFGTSVDEAVLELATKHPDYTSMVIVVMPDENSTANIHYGLTEKEVDQITGGNPAEQENKTPGWDNRTSRLVEERDDHGHVVDYRYSTD